MMREFSTNKKQAVKCLLMMMSGILNTQQNQSKRGKTPQHIQDNLIAKAEAKRQRKRILKRARLMPTEP